METLISICSFIIALCSLFFTLWQTHTQRTHNRISVKPHLFTFIERNKDNDSATIKVLLLNNGLGPAFINDFQIYLDGKPYDDAYAAIDEVIGSELSKNSSKTVLGDEYAMSANEKKTLISVQFKLDANNHIDEVETKLARLDLVIEYSSAYEKMDTYDTRKKKLIF